MKRILAALSVIVSLFVGVQPLLHAQGHQDFYSRPIPMGVSVSTTPTSPYLTAGTAGMRVYALANPNVKLILSNNHVLGATGPSLCPDSADDWPPPLTPVLQPGTLDLGFDPGIDPTYIAGAVVKTVPIRFGLGKTNRVDAAIAYTTPELASTNILGIGAPTPSLGEAEVGMNIVKSGRTTGVTTGQVTAVNTTVLVNYGAECGTAVFTNQIMTTAGMGTSGDSGSVVLESATLKPVGLYFAGGPFNGIMNPILSVYLGLGVFVDSESIPTLTHEQLLARAQAIAESPKLRLLKAIQARHQKDIVGRVPGVVGMGIGKSAAKDVFMIFAKKRTAALLAAVPDSIEGVPVRVLESGEFRPH